MSVESDIKALKTQLGALRGEFDSFRRRVELELGELQSQTPSVQSGTSGFSSGTNHVTFQRQFRAAPHVVAAAQVTYLPSGRIFPYVVSLGKIEKDGFDFAVEPNTLPSTGGGQLINVVQWIAVE